MTQAGRITALRALSRLAALKLTYGPDSAALKLPLLAAKSRWATSA